MSVVGLLPAVGVGSRLWPYAGYKWGVPVGISRDPAGARVRLAIESTLEQLAAAEIPTAFLCVPTLAPDLVYTHARLPRYSVRLELRPLGQTTSMPETLYRGMQWCQDAELVAFLMPDAQLSPVTALRDALRQHRESGADITLLLFEATDPANSGTVRLNADRTVAEMREKEPTDFGWMWGGAIWDSRFVPYLQPVAERRITERRLTESFVAAQAAGLSVYGYTAVGGSYLDVGTAEGLQNAWTRCK